MLRDLLKLQSDARHSRVEHFDRDSIKCYLDPVGVTGVPRGTDARVPAALGAFGMGEPGKAVDEPRANAVLGPLAAWATARNMVSADDDRLIQARADPTGRVWRIDTPSAAWTSARPTRCPLWDCWEGCGCWLRWVAWWHATADTVPWHVELDCACALVVWRSHAGCG